MGKPTSVYAIRTYAYDKVRPIKPFDIVEDYVI